MKTDKKLKFVQEHFEIWKLHNSNKETLDAHSAMDLDIPSLFTTLNHCETSAGDAHLYQNLHTPCRSKETSDTHKQAREQLSNSSEAQKELKKILTKTGRQGSGNLGVFLEKLHIPSFMKHRLLLLIPTLAPFVAGFIILLNPQPISIVVLIVLLALNMFIHYQIKRYTEADYSSIYYLSKVLSSLKKLKKSKSNSIFSPLIPKIIQDKIVRKINLSSIAFYQPLSPSMDLLYLILEYLRIFILLEANVYFSIIQFLYNNKEDFKQAYSSLGQIDQMQMEIRLLTQEGYCIPSIEENCKTIEAEEIRHPLIQNSVGNSFELKRMGNIVTGTNMAGKSSFLRTLGINQLLAGSMNIALAKSFKTGNFPIMTAIHSHDNLLENQSKYYNEVNRLKGILDSLENSDHKWLILIDEILSGTNTKDRVRAAIGILEYIQRLDRSFTIAATHDREIAERLKESFDLWYFSEELTQDEFRFSYKIQKGIVDHTNAFRILEFFHFPEEITK